ncbi:MAG: head-tail connector protein [Bacillota bacterium]
MPLNANALTTLQAAKEYLRIPVTETMDDALIESLINAVSGQMDGYCKRNLKQQVYTDKEYDGNDRSTLLLGEYPIASITSVKIDDVIVPASEYKIRKDRGALVRLDSKWPEGIMNVKISFTAGLSTVPANMELACKHLVMFYYKTDLADFSKTFGEGFVLRPEGLPRQIKFLLAPYRRVLI